MIGSTSPKVPCPKCKKLLKPEGEITLNGEERFLSYQCDTCTHEVMMFGKPVTVAVTFCVGEDGQPFDPAAPDEPFSLG